MARHPIFRARIFFPTEDVPVGTLYWALLVVYIIYFNEVIWTVKNLTVFLALIYGIELNLLELICFKIDFSCT